MQMMGTMMVIESGRVWKIGDTVPVEALATQEAWEPGKFGWYIVYTAGASEARVKAAMELRGWTVYLPKRGEWRPLHKPMIVRGRLRAERRSKAASKVPMERIEVPLYPGYLFVAARSEASEFWSLKVIHGVADVLQRAEGYPIRLGNAVIGEMEARAAQPETAATKRPKLLMPKVGTAMRVIAGPFASFNGVVTGCDEGGQVRIDVVIFGGATPVIMHLDDLELM